MVIFARFKKIRYNLDPSSIKSKVHYVAVLNTCIATKDWGEPSYYITIYPIPLEDQYVLRNTGFELSYLSKRWEVTKSILQASNNEINFGVQEIRGIYLLW